MIKLIYIKADLREEIDKIKENINIKQYSKTGIIRGLEIGIEIINSLISSGASVEKEVIKEKIADKIQQIEESFKLFLDGKVEGLDLAMSIIDKVYSEADKPITLNESERYVLRKVFEKYFCMDIEDIKDESPLYNELLTKLEL